MAIESWFRGLSTKITKALSKSHPINGLFLDDSCFRFELARERMRVDRNRSSLALLMIELPADRVSPRDFVFLGRVLLRRLRITDSIGILADGRVGVLLPDTAEPGAWKVASDVCGVYPVGIDRPNCEVSVYPERDARWCDEQPEHDRGTVATSSASTIEAFLAGPSPFFKRAIDVLGAITGLIVGAPLLALIAVAVKLTSRGPVLYFQEREGLGGRRFRIYKFRTMRTDAENFQAQLRPRSDQDGPAFKMRHDPRTTWLGHWLRVTSLDELPQLWNVLRGEMSLVGPRPLPISESLKCQPWQRRRLSVVPGLTCIWQVRGRSTVSFEQWMRMDLHYVQFRSLRFDLSLLLKTPPALLLQRGPR